MLRPIGWQQLAFSVPSDWQPSVIAHDYLLFEELYHPCCLIKWQNSSNFKPEALLRKLGKSLGKESIVEPIATPAPWKKAVGQCAPYAFTWKSEREKGCGLLLYNPVSQRICLFQFYGSPKDPKWQQLLATLRDKKNTAEQYWAMYDIEAIVPAGAVLQKHEFVAGRYMLEFSVDALQVGLYRLKPAAILLQNQDIAEFGRTLARSGDILVKKDVHSAEFQFDKKPFFLPFSRGKPPHSWTKVWHIPDKNTILAVHISGKHKAPQELQKMLCDNLHVRKR